MNLYGVILTVAAFALAMGAIDGLADLIVRAWEWM